MTKLRFLTSVAGEITAQAGDIIDLPEALAAKWADGVRAVRLDRETVYETTAARVPETTARRTKRAKGR